MVMGGAPACEGNVTPAAEYNIWVDPEAAQAVFRSKPKIEMVGWHVSRGPSVLKDYEIEAVEAIGTAKAKFAIDPILRPVRAIAFRPARPASRFPIRSRWRWRSTARSAFPGPAIAWRSSATAQSSPAA